MKKIKLILVICILQLGAKIGKAQIPHNDSAWVKQASLSDDFDTLGLRLNKWQHASTEGWPSDGASLNYLRNLYFTGHSIQIIGDTLNPNVRLKDSSGNAWHKYDTINYAYQGERIWSKNASYKYGYLEISAKVPFGRYWAWPAFWLWNQDCSVYFYNEIDIAENGGGDSKVGKTGTNMHITYSSPDCVSTFTNTNIPNSFQDLTSADTSVFHKYAVEWNPNSVSYYFDDVLLRTISSPELLPTYSMFAILELKIDPYHVKLPSNWDTTKFINYGSGPTGFPTPQYFEIGEMNYYKLTPGCSTHLTLSNLSSYDRLVKQDIKTDNSFPVNFNPSGADSKTLRATDYILLDSPTGTNSVIINPSGSGYVALEIWPCPN